MAVDFYSKAVAVTPSDTVNIANPGTAIAADALYVGGAGIVAAVFIDDSVVNFTAVAGEILPIRVKRVNSANTTATLIVGLYGL